MMRREDYDTTSEDRVKTILSAIEKKIIQKRDFGENCSEVSPLWIIIADTLTHAEKDAVWGELEEAGWAAYDLLNSEDNGERPGLFSVKLY